MIQIQATAFARDHNLFTQKVLIRLDRAGQYVQQNAIYDNVGDHVQLRYLSFVGLSSD